MIDIVCSDKLEEFGKKLGYSGIINIKELRVGYSAEDFNKKGMSIITGLEKIERVDSLHQRRSGFNQVLAKIAKKNKIALVFNFNDIIDSKKKSQIMGRISQNIKICRKYKVEMIIASFAKYKYQMRNPSDLMSLFILLGMTPKEAKDALNNHKVYKSKS